MNSLLPAAIILLISLALASFGQESGRAIVSIGMTGRYHATVEGVELKPKLDNAKPGVGRPIWIVSCDEETSKRAGAKRVWLIQYSAWKAADYDLRDLLEWPAGFNKEMVKPMIVTVSDPLPASHRGELEPVPRRDLDLPLPLPASWRAIAAGIWLAGFAGLLWLGWLRQSSRVGAFGLSGAPARRKLLEGIRTGSRSPLTPQTRAELQRQFLSLLLKDFGGAEGDMSKRLARLQTHPEGGPLLAQFDTWLESAAQQPLSAPSGVVQYLESVTGPHGQKT